MQYIFYNGELYHHGVQGQKWGVRNAEWYPIDEWKASLKNKVTVAKKIGSKVAGNSSIDKNRNNQFTLTDKQKQYIKIGAGVVVGAAALYGAYRLGQSSQFQQYIGVGMQAVGDLGLDVIDGVDEIKKLDKPEEISDIIKHANDRSNPANENNCTACATASFLRHIGFDVMAGPTGGPRYLQDVVRECFINARIIDTAKATTFGKSIDDASNMLVRKFGKNAEGVCSVRFKQRGKETGHAFNWIISNGVVTFFDGQNEKSPINDTEDIKTLWQCIVKEGPLVMARLDNADINFEGIKKYIQ